MHHPHTCTHKPFANPWHVPLLAWDCVLHKSSICETYVQLLATRVVLCPFLLLRSTARRSKKGQHRRFVKRTRNYLPCSGGARRGTARQVVAVHLLVVLCPFLLFRSTASRGKKMHGTARMHSILCPHT